MGKNSRENAQKAQNFTTKTQSARRLDTKDINESRWVAADPEPNKHVWL